MKLFIGIRFVSSLFDTAMGRVYTCPRCEYSTRDLHIMKRHLSRMTPCPPVHIDDEPGAILERLQKESRNTKKLACPYCDSAFSCRQSKYAHIKRFHSMDVQHTNHGSSWPPGSSMTIVNVNNNVINQNNHIVINAFGRESLEHVTPAFIDQCVRRTDKGIVELIEKIHFDPDVRENCNIKATNAKVPLVKYNDGARWKWGRKDKLLDEIVDRGHGLMQEHFDDHEDVMRNRLSISMFEHIRKWMDKMQDRDKKTWESVITDIYVLILNASAELEEGDA